MTELKIKPLFESLRDRLESGKITMRKARETLCECGWFNYLPSEDQVSELLNKYSPKNQKENED